jgi:BirA family biotin operon repressor/biotin-[acetyl-CoA-carboxylase] ligase
MTRTAISPRFAIKTLENTPYLAPVTFDSANAALQGSRFCDLRHVTSTGSTMVDVLEMLSEPTDHPSQPVVLVADHQTAGRGRLGRAWEAPDGASVLMTIGLPVLSVPTERRTLLTSALALAVVGAPSVEGVLKIKWPNDLVAPGVGADGSDRKVAGILAELHRLPGEPADHGGVPGRGDCVLLGIGLNVNIPEFPDELAGIAESLQRLVGHPVDRAQLVVEVLTAFEHEWLAALEDTTRRPDVLRDAYRDASATIGREVRVELPRAVLFGTASDVTETGELVVVDEQRVERILSVGDVVHLRPAE